MKLKAQRTKVSSSSFMISPHTEQSHRTVTVSASSVATRSETRKPKKKPPMYGSYHNARSRSLTNTNHQQRRPPNNVQERVMSARRNRINQLHNEMSVLKNKVEELNRENRLLKTLQHRQGKALRKLEDTESDLPRLISQHMEEQRVLKARLRKSQDHGRDLENKVRSLNEEADKMDLQLKRYKKLVNERNLAERSELSRNLSETQDKLYEVERRNQELMRNLELNTQSYMRQIKGEQQKHNHTKNELRKTSEECNILQNKLKEKERQLDVNNIYSLRGNRSSFISPSASHSTNQSLVIATKNPTPRKEKPAPVATVSSPEPPPAITAIERPQTPAKRSHSPVSVLASMPPQTIIKPPPTTVSPPPPEPPVIKRENSIPLIKFDTGDSPMLAANEKPPPAFFTEASTLSRVTTVQDEDSDSEVIKSSDNFTSLENEITVATALSHQVNDEEVRAKEQENNKKLEEEQRKKAALLAKMREIDEEENSLTPRERKVNGNDELNKILNSTPPEKLRSSSTVPDPAYQNEDFDRELARFFAASLALHRLNEEGLEENETSQNSVKNINRSSNNTGSATSTARKKKVKRKGRREKKTDVEAKISFQRRVENLHQGIPTTQKELSFGSYSPSIQSKPRRRSRPQQAANTTTTTTTPRRRNEGGAVMRGGTTNNNNDDDDSPLLDLNSGKPNKKKSENLLNQLFGDQSSTPTNNTRSNGSSKTSSSSQLHHDGYPWEKNVMTKGGPSGDPGVRPTSRDKLIVSPLAKVRPPIIDDDIEELAL